MLDQIISVAQRNSKCRSIVDEAFKKCDKNYNGTISRSEAKKCGIKNSNA